MLDLEHEKVLWCLKGKRGWGGVAHPVTDHPKVVGLAQTSSF